MNNQRPQQRTAADVAQLESDNDYLHSEVERLTHELAIVKGDRSRLQIENAMLLHRASENLIKATRMETIVRHISSGLVDALNGVTREREAEREVRRRIQEDRLGVGGDDAPLGGSMPPPPPWGQVAAALRNEAVTQAAEQIGPSRTQVAPIDHTIAEKDARIPPVQYGPTEDERDLQALADHIQGNGKES